MRLFQLFLEGFSLLDAKRQTLNITERLFMFSTSLMFSKMLLYMHLYSYNPQQTFFALRCFLRSQHETRHSSLSVNLLDQHSNVHQENLKELESFVYLIFQSLRSLRLFKGSCQSKNFQITWFWRFSMLSTSSNQVKFCEFWFLDDHDSSLCEG